MADSITESETNDIEAPGESILKLDQQEKALPESLSTQHATTPLSTIIWTPRFIVIFALILVLGLSAESLLTLGWINHDYIATWVFLAHVALIFACLAAIILTTRSWWIRMGAIFGCTWAIFTSLNLLIGFSALDPTSPIPAYLNAAICSALLGASICLSIERTPFTAWDSWFFRLALLVGVCAVPLSYFLKPAAERSLSTIESAIAAIGLVFCILVWWLRPSCWQTQPGPTFLLGLTPTILLLLSIPSLGSGSTNFFLSQVAFLSLLLGSIRILQAELRQMHTSSH